MLRIQQALGRSLDAETQSDIDESDLGLPTPAAVMRHKLKLPRKLQGWPFLLRPSIRIKGQVLIMQQAGGSLDFKETRKAVTVICLNTRLRERDGVRTTSRLAGRQARHTFG